MHNEVWGYTEILPHFSVWDIQVHTEGSKKEIKPTWKFILEQWYNNRPKMTACLNPQFATINRIVSEQSTSWPSKLALVSQGPKAILLSICPYTLNLAEIYYYNLL